MKQEAAKPARRTTGKSESPRRTQADRRSESDRKLIAAALRLIAMKGADRTSLGEVGVTAGYSRGLPGERFGSKLQFLEAIVDNMDSWFQARAVQAVGTRKGLAAVLALVEAHFEAARNAPDATKALEQLYMDALGALPELKPRMVRFRGVLTDRFVRELRAAQKAGEIRAEVNAANYARVIVASMGGVVQQSFFDAPTRNLGALQKDYTAQLKRYLKP